MRKPQTESALFSKLSCFESKTKATYALVVKYCLDDITNILTQLKQQGVLLNPERLNWLQEEVNRLDTLLNPSQTPI